MRKLIFFIVINLVCFNLSAQFSNTQKLKINRSIEDCVKKYQDFLNNVLDESETKQDRQSSIDDYVPEIFLNNTINIPCAFCVESNPPASSYFSSLLTSVLLKSNKKVEIQTDEGLYEYFKLSDKKSSKNEIYIRLPLDINWNSRIIESKKDFSKEKFYFIFQINISSVEYVAKILNVAKERAQLNNEQSISFDSDNSTKLEEKLLEKEYYLDRLNQAKYFLGQKKWAKAFWCAKEAEKGKKLLGNEMDEIENVKRNVRIEIKNNHLVDESETSDVYLKTELIKLAKESTVLGMYELAMSYYGLALNIGDSEIKKNEIEENLASLKLKLNEENLIESYVQDKNYSQAILKCKTLLGSNQNNTKLMSRLALIYGLNNQFEDADAYFRKAKNINPKDAFIYLSELEMNFKLSQLKTINELAKEYFSFAEFGAPANRRVSAMNAYASAWMNKIWKNNLVAIDSCDAAIKSYPYFAEPYVLKAELVERKEAEKILDNGLIVLNNDKEKSKIYKAKQKYGDSKSTALKDIISYDKKDAEALYGIANSFNESAFSLNRLAPNDKRISMNLDSAIYYYNLVKANLNELDKKDIAPFLLRLTRAYLFRDNSGDPDLALGIIKECENGEYRMGESNYIMLQTYAYIKAGSQKEASSNLKKLNSISLDNLVNFLVKIDINPNDFNNLSEDALINLFCLAQSAPDSFFNAERIEKDLRSFGKESLLDQKKMKNALKAMRRKS